ncbi:hypothetical protein [Chitinimonas lacunae]|uniref:Uncharacterized protein n=1 Tax=Chitinimonas lacunae TaxID=1963018 RepID=A0ABV8MNI2_9NEIS
MVIKEKLLSLAEMESIAKQATFEALKSFKPPRNRENLTLGSGITDEEGIFELYLAGEMPKDAEVVSRATVNRLTGAVKVDVFLPPA